jgi:hypothetical protein
MRTDGVGGPASPDEPAHDGLDDEVWRRLVGILSAANHGDGDQLARLLRSYDAAMTDGQRFAAGAYVAFILRFRVIEPLARRPNDQDLRELAGRIYLSYARVSRESVVALEDTLRAVFLMPKADDTLAGARLFISAATAAGILLGEPVDDLASLRPRVARWRARDATAEPG